MRKIYLLLFLLYVMMTVATIVINPLFEAPDEHHHFFTALYIAETGNLPVVDQNDKWVRQEAAQPPLYYWLGSWLVRHIDTTSAQAQEAIWLNPYVRMGDASAAQNINRMVHDTEDTIHRVPATLLRGLSLLFGLGTLICIGKTADLLWQKNRRRTMLAVGFFALLPQFIFLHSYANNDTAVIFFTSAVVWKLVAYWRTDMPTKRQILLIGILLACAILSKTAGIIVTAYALIFIIMSGMKLCEGSKPSQGWTNRLQHAIFLLLPVILFSGWWFVRNWMLYEDVTAVNQFVEQAGGNRDISLLGIVGEMGGIWRSMIAVFGWFNVVPPRWVYWIVNSIIGLAVAGAFRAHKNKINLVPTRLLALLPIMLLAGMILFMLRTPAAQGRLLLPAVVPFALGISYGLSQWRWGWLTLPIMFCISLFCIVGVIRPAYAPPQPITTIPSSATETNHFLTPSIELVGWEMETNELKLSEWATVDLYWRGHEPLTSERNKHDVVLELFGRDNIPIGKMQSYPGRGLFPITMWQPGIIYHDQIMVQVEQDAIVPVLARPNLKIVNGDNVDLSPIKMSVETQQLARDAMPIATINDQVALLDTDVAPQTVTPGQTITVAITWHVIASPAQPLTTLIHVGTAGEQPLAQGDHVPVRGAYPTTAWAAGERIADHYSVLIPVDMPSGTYPIRVGMYDSAFARLPVAGDTVSADQTITIASVTVDNPMDNVDN